MLLRPVLMPVLRNPLQGIADSVRDFLAELRGSSAFWADLTHTAIPIRSNGETATYTGGATYTVNNDGYQVQGLANEIMFPGARRIDNLIRLGAAQSSTLAVAASVTMTLPAGAYQFSMGAGTGTATFSGTGGAIGTLVASTDRVHVAKTITAGTLIVTASVADLIDIQVVSMVAETDQTTIREYVSVGVESAPFYHGSMVDGVKCFPTDLAGVALTTMERYKPEPAATQIIAATADIRDMTTANWVLGATMTRARTSVGADGAANSATRLTGGAVAATNNILYTVTAAASSRTYSALVRRVTGTGPVRIIQTGTETDISSQLATTGYALVQLNASVLNVAIGFKIDTNGDAIDVDFNQFEAGAKATSRIATGGGTRNAHLLTYTGGNCANFKMLHCGMANAVFGVINKRFLQLDDGTESNRIQIAFDIWTGTVNTAVVSGGVAQFAPTAQEQSTGKISTSFSTNDFKADFYGTGATPDTSGTVPIVTTLRVGGTVTGTEMPDCNIGPVAAWTRLGSQSEMGALDRA